jgi:hypothetical protein
LAPDAAYPGQQLVFFTDCMGHARYMA